MSKKLSLVFAVLMMFSVLLSACQPTEIIKTVEVEKKVVETVEVEKKVIETVEVEKQVEVTAVPVIIETWAAADVTTASGADKCTPLAALPKTFKTTVKIGFVGANNAHPFHGLFQKGAEDAAKFYGVEFVNVDAAGAPVLDFGETIMTQGVMAFGVLGQGMDAIDPLGASAQEKSITFIPADSGKTEYSPYTYGVSDALSGKRGGELLAEGVTAKMAGDWKDKELFFLEATHTGIPACVARTGGAAKAFAAAFTLDAEHLIKMDSAAGNVSDIMKATLTAHPDAVFGMIPCWDQLGVDPWTVAGEAGRGTDVMLVTLGGDKPYADLLITKPENYFGYIEFQPYCEGWGWTETALAVLEGVPVVPYVPRMATTQATVEQRYIELYGALPTKTP